MRSLDVNTGASSNTRSSNKGSDASSVASKGGKPRQGNAKLNDDGQLDLSQMPQGLTSSEKTQWIHDQELELEKANANKVLSKAKSQANTISNEMALWLSVCPFSL